MITFFERHKGTGENGKIEFFPTIKNHPENTQIDEFLSLTSVLYIFNL